MGKYGEKAIENYKSQVQYMLEYGEVKASDHFGIKIETLHRNKRKYFEHIGSDSLDNKTPKVLLFDLETSPITAFVWGLFKQNISHESIIQDQHLISWSAKWLNEAEVFGDVQTPSEAKKHDDKRISSSLWEILDSADVIVAHNLKRYDRKVANTSFIRNGLKPPSPYQQIDTLEIAKKEFRFTSNRLDYLGKLMTNHGKIETNMDLWKGCFYGNQEDLDYMFKYNKQDVVLLEEVYYELRPFMSSHPNLAIYAEAYEEMCVHCGSTNLKECGDYATPAGRFDALRCEDCGAILRRRKSTLSKGQKENLLVSTAR